MKNYSSEHMPEVIWWWWWSNKTTSVVFSHQLVLNFIGYHVWIVQSLACWLLCFFFFVKVKNNCCIPRPFDYFTLWKNPFVHRNYSSSDCVKRIDFFRFMFVWIVLVVKNLVFNEYSMDNDHEKYYFGTKKNIFISCLLNSLTFEQSNICECRLMWGGFMSIDVVISSGLWQCKFSTFKIFF